MSAKRIDWRKAILAAYAAVTFGAMFRMGSPEEASWYALSIPFLLFAILPVALLSVGAKSSLLTGMGALVLAAAGTIFYVHTAWFAAPDAQAGLIFVFLPLYQLVAAAIWLGLVRVFARLTHQER
ncbi:MAG: hypothetical protein AB3N06_02200 [Erythrobacter sp.]